MVKNPLKREVVIVALKLKQHKVDLVQCFKLKNAYMIKLRFEEASIEAQVASFYLGAGT